MLAFGQSSLQVSSFCIPPSTGKFEKGVCLKLIRIKDEVVGVDVMLSITSQKDYLK
jgi:hypothetical protein